MEIIFNLNALEKVQYVIDENGVIYMIRPESMNAQDKIGTSISFMASKLPLEKHAYREMTPHASTVGLFETRVFYNKHMNRIPVVGLLDSHECDIVITDGGFATIRDDKKDGEHE